MKCQKTDVVVNYFENSNLSLPLFFDRHVHLILLKSSTSRNPSSECRGAIDNCMLSDNLNFYKWNFVEFRTLPAKFGKIFSMHIFMKKLRT